MTANALTLDLPQQAPFIDYEREFDAPVAELFRAHADPDLLARWLGPRGYEMTVHEYDFRTGGGYHYTHTGDDGASYGFRGVFHTVRENELAIQTFEYDGVPDVVSIEYVRFVDLGNGRSKLVGHAVYPTLEARDGMASSGMETGMSQGYDQLEELLTGTS